MAETNCIEPNQSPYETARAAEQAARAGRTARQQAGAPKGTPSRGPPAAAPRSEAATPNGGGGGTGGRTRRASTKRILFWLLVGR